MSDIVWKNDTIKLGDLQPWEHNPRYSTEKQAERIADSHRLFGQVETIAIGPNGEVLNGHQRLSAWLAEYGADYKVDVRRASRTLDDRERQALTAMLHAGAVGSWDWDSLANWDVDILQGFGFDEDLLKDWQRDTFALGDLLASENGNGEPPETAPQIDRAEELRQKWGVELGQLWQLGEHRLICGDCTDRAVVERVMGGDSFDVLTDPPYSDYYEEEYRYKDEILNFLSEYDNKQFVFWSAKSEFPLDYSAIHIWDKKTGVASQYERIFERNGQNGYKVFRHYLINSTVAASYTGDTFEGHKSQKPIALVLELLQLLDKEIIVDFFCGSGTTIIACENLNRRCRAIEIDPGYVAVSLQRWADHTGKQPQLLK